MTTDRVAPEDAGVEVDPALLRFINEEAIAGTGVRAGPFWNGLVALVRRLAPRNAELLAKRVELQRRLDAWHQQQPGTAGFGAAYEAMLGEIGYLLPEGPAFAVETENVDAEISTLAGPQLVVPVSNARYALNAANARWGSLYDALYGTDAISEADGAQRGADYNPVRGARVVAYGREFLDRHFPLLVGSHGAATAYRVSAGKLEVVTHAGIAGLRDEPAFAGHRGSATAPTLVLLRHHGLHVELHIDRNHPVGNGDPAGISDLVLESALSTIQDLEDSVAAVDAQDKIAAYRNWLGLMRGTLEAQFPKAGGELTRFADDWVITCKSVAEARAALAAATRILERLGVRLNPQKTRIVHIQQGFDFLGYRMVRASGKSKLSRSTIQRWNPKGLIAYPTRKSILRFRDRVRMLTRRSAQRKTAALIEELNPTLRGWAEYYKRAHVRTLFHKLDGWIVRRIWSHRACIATCWCTAARSPRARSICASPKAWCCSAMRRASSSELAFLPR
jgi:hypothetical protein